MVFRNVMGHLKRTEASAMALQLAEELLPLFDDVRLMWEPEPCRWAPCNDSCPSAQPCEQRSRQGLLSPSGSCGMASGCCSPARLPPTG